MKPSPGYWPRISSRVPLPALQLQPVQCARLAWREREGRHRQVLLRVLGDSGGVRANARRNDGAPLDGPTQANLGRAHLERERERRSERERERERGREREREA